MNWIKIICAGLLITGCVSGKKTSQTTSTLPVQEARKFDYFFLESLRQKNQGNEDAAFDLMRKAVAIDTASAAARYELATYFMKLNRPLIALENVQRASAADPDNYWYGMLEAHLLQGTNNVDEAVKVYSHLAQVYPNKPEINYSLADVYTRMGEPQKAIDALNRMEKNLGVIEALSMEKFRLYMDMKQTDKAFEEIQKLIQSAPGNIQYQILLGDLYLESGDLVKAREAYENAAKLEPNNAYLLISLSEYYNKIGDIPASNELLTNALVNDKLDAETKIKMLTGYLTTLLQKKESLAQTDSLFAVIIDQHPHESEIYSLYAELLMATERYADAREQLEYAVDFNPNDKRTWLQLIGVDMRLEDWKSVVKTAHRARAYFPSLPELYIYGGAGYSMEKKYKEALHEYKEGLKKIDPTNVQMISDLWGQIGDSYFQMNDRANAYKAYDEALKYNDKNIVTLNNYSYYLSVEKKDLPKAEKMAGMVIKLDPGNSTYLDTYAWIFFQQGSYMLAKFYIESAIANGGDKSDVIVEHYGDILYMDGEHDKALEQWKKSLEMGNTSKVLKKKIETKTYIEE